MTSLHHVWLLLGGNQGDVEHVQESALRAIEELIGAIVAKSKKYWTEPWGFTHQNLFLNRAVEVLTSLPAQEVLQAIHRIENEHGRERSGNKGYTARPLDIDILFYGEQVINEPSLTIPHPLIHERAFALVPLAEICPNKVHPVLHRTVRELLDQVQDPEVK